MPPNWTAPRVAAWVLPPLLCWLVASPVMAEPAGDAEDAGTPAAFTIEDPRIHESSGLQASRLHPGVYWTHNDSGYEPDVYAVDSATGETVAKITLDGVEGRDLEAIHLGPDGALYVGDIGDNFDGGWPLVWVYRFAEPEQLADATVTPTVHGVQYEDGPRDAEALMVHPETGRVYIASKERADGGLYAGPDPAGADAATGGLSETETNTFERIAEVDFRVTDGAFSPDGTRLLLRGYFSAEMYSWADGGPERVGRVQVPLQPQGESVTFTPDGRTLMFGSEGERSEVRPVPLAGELLPDSARAKDEAGADGAADGQEDDTPDTEASEEEEQDVTRLLTVFVLGTVLVIALRRIFRHRDDN